MAGWEQSSLAKGGSGPALKANNLTRGMLMAWHARHVQIPCRFGPSKLRAKPVKPVGLSDHMRSAERSQVADSFRSSDQQMRRFGRFRGWATDRRSHLRCGSGPTVSRPHDRSRAVTGASCHWLGLSMAFAVIRISSHTLPRSGSGTVFYERRAWASPATMCAFMFELAAGSAKASLI